MTAMPAPTRSLPSLAREASRRLDHIAHRLPDVVRSAADKLELLDGWTTSGGTDGMPRGSSEDTTTERAAKQRIWVTTQLDNIRDLLLALIAVLEHEGYAGLLSSIERAIQNLEGTEAITDPRLKRPCGGGLGLPGAFHSRHPDTGEDDSWGDDDCGEETHALGVCAKHYRRYTRWCLRHGVTMRDRDPEPAVR